MSPLKPLLLFFYLSSLSNAYPYDYSLQEPTLDPQEQEAIYQVLEAANPELDWRSTYPDDLCTAGPHGILCEPDETAARTHVVELNIGWVSDYSNNPTCSPTNASFSPSLSLFTYLRKLFFYNCFSHQNHPVSLPPFLWSLGQQLQELVFQYNPRLIGRLPPELANLAGLRRLIISGTRISGAIPAEIKALKHLQQLDLSNNVLNHTLPFTLGELRELVVLDLNRNAFGGQVPESIGSLIKLSKLDLSCNNITGGIPGSFGSLHDLEMLDLGRNQIGGGLPLFLGALPKLKNLHLKGNPIGGSLPDFWDGLKELISLDLSGVGLVGEIPVSMGDLSNLSFLALDHNRLSGAIPLVIADLPSIHHIDLSHNRLSGLVPFSALLVERLGPKLRLGGNEELCFDPETVASFSERLVDIGGCPSVLLSSMAADTDCITSSSDDCRSEKISIVFHLVPVLLAILFSMH